MTALYINEAEIPKIIVHPRIVYRVMLSIDFDLLFINLAYIGVKEFAEQLTPRRATNEVVSSATWRLNIGASKSKWLSNVTAVS